MIITDKEKLFLVFCFGSSHLEMLKSTMYRVGHARSNIVTFLTEQEEFPE